MDRKLVSTAIDIEKFERIARNLSFSFSISNMSFKKKKLSMHFYAFVTLNMINKYREIIVEIVGDIVNEYRYNIVKKILMRIE